MRSLVSAKIRSSVMIAVPYVGGVLFMLPVYLEKYDSILKAVGMSIGASIFGYLWTLWFFLPLWLLSWLLIFLQVSRHLGVICQWLYPCLSSAIFCAIFFHFSTTLFKQQNELFAGVFSIIGGFMFGMYLTRLENRICDSWRNNL